MGWGSEQITGILGSILNSIGDGISGIGEKLRETAKIVTDSDETETPTPKPKPGQTQTIHSSENKSYSSKTTNQSSYTKTDRNYYSKGSTGNESHTKKQTYS